MGMDWNALGVALGNALDSGFKGYSWMKGLEDEQKQAKAKADTDERRHRESLQAGQDAIFARGMADEDKYRADLAQKRAEEKAAKDAADRAFEEALAMLPPEQQRSARAARGLGQGGVNPSLTDSLLNPKPAAETPDQKSAREIKDFEEKAKITNRYRPPEKPDKPERTTLTPQQTAQLEQWYGEQIAGLAAKELTGPALDAAKAAIDQAYKATQVLVGRRQMPMAGGSGATGLGSVVASASDVSVGKGARSPALQSPIQHVPPAPLGPSGKPRVPVTPRAMGTAMPAAPAPPAAAATAPARSVSQAQIAAVARKNGTTVQQEAARATAEGFTIVR